MPLPNFLIIGAQKSGTTWLANNLLRHPDVFIPDYEIHYFDKEYNFKKGISWYESHFKEANDERCIGEKTPDYLWVNHQGVEGHLPEAHLNIHKTLPEVKLIMVLRNPVERAISAVNHIINSGLISPLHSIDDLLVGHKRYLIEGHGVIDYGRYYRKIKAYQEYFHSDQMLVLIFEEEVVWDPTSGLRRVCQFLGIDDSFAFPNKQEKIHETGWSTITLAIRYHIPILYSLARCFDPYLPKRKAYPGKSTLRKLHEIYAKENEKLFALLGRRVASWQESDFKDG